MMTPQLSHDTAEHRRLEESRSRTVHWKRWGPYLSERAWGTVREDYSPQGTVWAFFPHEQARSKAYRWNEDGIAGISDRHQKICFAIALWNHHDPILKERLFGLNGKEGNHGEDVKECYYYLDNTPTHSYMRMLYKYPQAEFPYAELLEENRRRGRTEPEYELTDTKIFDGNRYFDVFVEYAKAHAEDILIRIRVINRGPDAAPLELLPTLWFRNRWTWDGSRQPRLWRTPGKVTAIELDESYYGHRRLVCEGNPQLLFTGNDTNDERLYGQPNSNPFVKDGIGEAVVNGRMEAVNPAETGTKVAARYSLLVPPGGELVTRLRLSDAEAVEAIGAAAFDRIFTARQQEAEQFYATVISPDLPEDARNVMRQAFGGLLWSKQYYHYIVRDWLQGDPAMPPPPSERQQGRNHDWGHLYNADVISMPDKWEYPWYAAWDLAFHTVPLALVDSDFAKQQLILMLREWYMHPNGQLPAYEWNLADVNPPVHAWAAWRVYKIEKKRRGIGDTAFLERVFHKLLLNFTWWVNRKDAGGRNIFQGGFLGLDNIGILDRSRPLPTGGYIEQADGTGWMAMYCLNLLAIAMELASHDPVYEDVASKFWEHFLHIAAAMTHLGNDGVQMWNEEEDWFFDVLSLPNGSYVPLKIRSMVGLIPLFAVETLEPEIVDRLPGFKRRLEWFIDNRPDLTVNAASMRTKGCEQRRLLSVVPPERLKAVLRVMLDENQMLSPYGVRALSRAHKDNPYSITLGGAEYRVAYEPGESESGLFGGNSNWRGPVWFPVNFLIIESLQRFHHYFGDTFTVECPAGSGVQMTLWEVAAELSRRLSRIFLRDPSGQRPVNGGEARYRDDPYWRDLVLFYEYFHGDNGRGLGASHQTGWTALVAKLLQQSGVE
ncbi:MAG: glucosidase [Bryobacterales bacterium]|nr:glucosidase [Bryobacterales bacterium]